MRETKLRMECFAPFDFQGAEKHLSAMAAKGWQLEKAGNQIWTYRRAEPAAVRYAVTYSDSASQFNPEPTEGQQSLAELCAAAGWEKVDDWFQMQIFRTQDPKAIPLETDEGMRLEGIHRAMRKNFLPSCIVLLAVGLLMSSSLVYSLISGKIYRMFSQNSSVFSGVMFLLVAALELYQLAHYYGWRKKSRRSVEEGGSCAPIRTRTYQRLNAAGLVLVGVLLAAYLALEAFLGGRGLVLFFVVYSAQLFLLMFLVRRTTAVLRKRKFSKEANIVGTLVVDVVLACVLVGGMGYGTLHFGWFFDNGGSRETYEYQGRDWDVSPREDVPLTLSGLTGEAFQHVDRNWRQEGSWFLPRWEYWESALGVDGDEEFLSYTIWEPRFRRLYDATVEHFLEKNRTDDGPIYGITRAYLPEDPEGWGAEAVYRRYFNGTPMNTWLLCYPERIVQISPEEPPAEAQKTLVAERLGA